MNITRIRAIIFRHLIPTLRDPMRLMDMIYWPLLDIVLWGLTSLWLGSLAPNDQKASAMLLSALVLWQVVFRASIEVTRGLLEEIWHENFVNLFASPLKLSEWMVSIMMVSFLSSLWNLFFGSLVIHMFFRVNVFELGLMIAPFFVMLLCFGWFLGFLAASVILRFGRRAEMIAWSLPWFFAAFSCVFYPASVLPPAIQKISWSLPATYIFESARSIIATDHFDWAHVLIGFLLGAAFLSFALTLFVMAFRRAKNLGLGSLG